MIHSELAPYGITSHVSSSSLEAIRSALAGNAGRRVGVYHAAELGTLLKPSSKDGRATPSAKPIDPLHNPVEPLKLYVHIADVNFSSTLQPNSHVLHSNDAMRLQVFNVPRAAVTRLITEQVVQHAPQSDNEVAHYVIVGMGAMGQTLKGKLSAM